MPVDVIIPVLDPEERQLSLTVDSILSQSTKPNKIIIVDSSRRPYMSDKRLVKVLHKPGMGGGDARKQGVDNSNSEYVMHIDWDSILVTEDYIERGISHLQKEGVAGAGGVIIPLKNGVIPRTIAEMEKYIDHPLLARNIIHRREILGPHARRVRSDERGEDIDIRRLVMSHGALIKDTGMVSTKDVPTTRQKDAIKTVELVGVGAILDKLIR